MASTTALTTVQKLYIAYYGRAADAAGQRFWADQLDAANGSLVGIIDAFATSAEAQALYGSGTTTAQRITTLYQNILGRNPDTPGLNYYVDQVNRGKLSLGNAALAILDGVRGTDVPLAENRMAVANAFTSQVSTTDQGYKGDVAAPMARSLLKTSSATNVNTQLAIDADIAASDDSNTALGLEGNSMLEVQQATIEAMNIVNQATYQNTLGAVRLVKDITPGAASSFWNGHSAPVVANDMLYFGVNTAEFGYELWRSDGTEAGTMMVADINPGKKNGLIKYWSINNTLYLYANDGFHGGELWMLDSNGILKMLFEIYPGEGSSYIDNLTLFNNNIYFTAENSTLHKQIWKIDNEGDPTVLTEMHSKLPRYPGSYARNLTPTGEKLFFIASPEYWEGRKYGTDKVFSIGTNDSVELITPDWSDFGGDYGYGRPSFIANANGIVYFAANEYTNTSGTPALLAWDTKDEEQVLPRAVSYSRYDLSNYLASNYLAIGNKFYFSGDAGHYGENVLMMMEVEPGKLNDATYASPVWTDRWHDDTFKDPENMVNLNDNLYFTADNGTDTSLWRTDGTVAGTLKILDFKDVDLVPGSIKNLVNIKNNLYFSASNGKQGVELWRSDGTQSGTAMVADINPGAADSSPYALTLFKNNIYFYATRNDVGTELFALPLKPMLGAPVVPVEPPVNESSIGGAGSDTLFGGNGPDLLYGGANTDVAIFSGSVSRYEITHNHGKTIVRSLDRALDIDTLINIETLRFDDADYPVENAQHHTWIASLYGAVLDRQADLAGFEHWAERYEAGMSIGDIAMSFLYSAEYQSKSGLQLSELSTAQRLDLLYENLLERAPDETGYTFWINRIENGMSISDIAQAFVVSAEMQGMYVQPTSWAFLL